MRFYAFHGVGPQEKAVGNHFLISLSVTTSLDRAAESDDLNDTINYADIYAVVKHEMDIPSRLVEHVAARIIRSLKKHFPRILETELSLSKLNPPVTAGDIRSAGVVIKETYA